MRVACCALCLVRCVFVVFCCSWLVVGCWLPFDLGLLDVACRVLRVAC